MSEEKFANISPDLTSEACAWVAQLETGSMTPEDIAALREWVNRSPLHYNELRAYAEFSGSLNILTDFAFSINETIKRKKAISSRPRYKMRGSLSNWAGVLSAIVFMSIIGVWVFNSAPAPEPYMIATSVGKINEWELPDHSKVHLNTNSQVEVGYNKSQRRLRLLTGEAFFEVEHNPERPFVVYAGDKRIEAVGTAFSVRWIGGDLDVTVQEGRVVILPSLDGGAVDNKKPINAGPANKAAPPLFLDAKQKYSLVSGSHTELLSNITERGIQSELSWQSGILDFTQRPLQEIINEINRYSQTNIEISDPALKELQFSGIFRIGDTAAFLEVLELSFNLEIVRENGNVIKIQHPETIKQ